MEASPGLPGLLWLLVVLVGLPLASMPRLMDPRSIPRHQIYISASLSLWVLSLLTVGVVLWEGMGAGALSLRAVPPVPLLFWSLGALAASLALLVALLGLQALAGHRESDVVDHLLPKGPGDREFFILLAFSAGACEEWIFRGFALGALAALTGNAWLAVGLQALAFGIAHAYQSPWGMLRAGLLGCLLCVPPLVTGSLWPSALAHVLLDVVAAFWIWPLFASRLSPAERSHSQ